MGKNYYIGPAGWSYKDWEGIVYPLKKGKNFHPLKYISHYFDTVEINSSFYRPPIAKTTQLLLDVYHYKGKIYIHPIKVQKRFSPTMYMLH